MDDPMETERVADASKRLADTDSSPRERKRARVSKKKDPSSASPTERKSKTKRGAKAVTPESGKLRDAPTVKNEGSLPTPPASFQADRGAPTDESRPPVTFATERTPTETSSTAPPTAEDINQLLAASNPPAPSSRFPSLFHLLLVLICGCTAAAFLPRTTPIRSFGHIIPPKHAIDAKSADLSLNLESFLSNVTLREFLTNEQGYHLAMAPSFFGFFGYFGLLAAWDEGLVANSSYLETNTIQSAAGASAGAMAAMLLAMGISPGKAAEFCGTIDLPTFADPPGIGSFFKGDKFEELMLDFMKQELPDDHSLQMEDSKIPVAVTGFDLQTLSTLVITKGSAAQSSRASATFPFLFQPVHWFDAYEKGKDYILIDGGVLDGDGLIGLSLMEPENTNKRIVNLVVGNFGAGAPPGPSQLPPGVSASELLSVSMRNLPGCGPWAMENGPKAVQAAKNAMMASLDLPLYRGKEDGHYELHIDASSFAPTGE